VNHKLVQKLRRAAAHSELVQTMSSVRRDGGRLLALGDTSLRPLYRDEIAQLESQGNSSPDWSRVCVVDGFDYRRIHRSSFHGDVVLGRCTRQVKLAEGFELPAGIYQSTLVNCVIGPDVLIRDVKLLANYAVCENAVLFDCSAITCEGKTRFGNGAELPLGVESGGREVAVFAEIDVETAASVACSRASHAFQKEYRQAVADYAAQVESSRGVIGTGAIVRATPKVRNTYVGAAAQIDGATLIADSTILSNAEEPVRIESGACVSRSLLQWGSRVATLGVVERSVLAEHSHVEQHGKVADSLLGPNSTVESGEVTASLVGPFVNMHHQALLIATLWPEGKGNVSYGVNAGSNHTSRAPDQEFRPGEGAFLGLGVSVKFPADFTRAPYLVVASATTLLPQKICFPFSLVNAPAVQYPDVSPAYNQIIPAWLLTDNLFALKRNESKFRARNRARRTTFAFEVLRPDTVDLMRDAYRRLAAVRQPKEIYTDRDIEGLGKNFLLEAHRVAAMVAYQYFVRYYGLLALRDEVAGAVNGSADESTAGLLVTPSSKPHWEHARRILCDDFRLRDVAGALCLLPPMLEEIARGVQQSKAKDDERGARIIDDYLEAHVPAADHPFVRECWADARRLQREVHELLARLQAPCPGQESVQPSHIAV
jgi:hypothetical protein